MTHTLRKYLSSRGSALFMVLSTMTALMIAAMAMYFSVISSRQVQYAVFYEEQSYQSAVSITDAIIAGMNNGKLNGLQSDILKLKVGSETETGTLSTDGNGFKAFGATGDDAKDDDNRLGAYDLTVTRLADSGDYQMYDFSVASSVNGVQEATHTMVMVKKNKRGGDGINDLFTATSYVPNQNFISRGTYHAALKVDVPNAIFGLGDQTPNIEGNLTCSGTAQFNGIGSKGSDPLVWTFGGDLIMNNGLGGYDNGDKALNLNGTAEKPGVIYVGGDLYAENANYFQIHSNQIVYVLGNFYGKSVQIQDKGVLVVGGELHIDETGPWGPPINGNGLLVMTDKAKIIKNSDNTSWTMPGYVSFKYQNWSELDTETYPKVLASAGQVGAEIDEIIGNTTYPIWRVDWDKDEYLKGSLTSTTEIVYNTGGDNNVAMVKYNGKEVPKRAVFESEDLKWTPEHHGCRITGIVDAAADPANVIMEDGSHPDTGKSHPGGMGQYTIIVDTGDDPDNVFYLGLEPNRKITRDGQTVDVFSWAPTSFGESYDDYDYLDPNYGTNIIVRGRGSLAIIVPDGVIYQSQFADFIGHENWYMLLGGDVQMDSTCGRKYGKFTPSASEVMKLIHHGCTDCKCDIDPELKEYEDSLGNKKEGYYCSTHEYVVDEYTTGGECCCNNRVGRQEIDAVLGYNRYNDTSADIHFNLTTTGEFVYPTVNIWLVMAGDNAEMMFTNTLNGEYIQNSVLMGYIYAPYMSFVGTKPPGDGSEGAETRLVGGAIVSDVKLYDYTDYVFCKPEKIYTDIGGLKDKDTEDYEGRIGDITWRVYGH